MRNGAGTYNLPQAPFTPGNVISSTAVNSNFSDIANALTQSLANDGQTVPTANLPMGNYRHTGVGNAAARTDYAAMGQVQDGAGIWCGTAGGTANALTLTPSPAITAYAAGQVFRFQAGAAANTGATTLAVSGLTAQAVQLTGAALTGGEIVANQWYSVQYDGTNFQLQGFSTVALAANIVGTTQIANDAVTNGKLANMAANTVKVRAAATTGDPSDLALSASQLVGRGSTGDVAALTLTNGIRANGVNVELAPGAIVDRAFSSYTTNTALSTSLPFDDTIPQNTEGTQILSASITPKTTTNRLRVRFTAMFGTANTGGGHCSAAFFLNSTANAIHATTAYIAATSTATSISEEWEFVPGATSAQTIAVRVGGNGFTMAVNGPDGVTRRFGGVAAATLVLEEIVA